MKAYCRYRMRRISRSVFFSCREYVILKELAGHRRDRAFFSIWSMKEALIKANGWSLDEGLAACCAADVFDNDTGRVMPDDGRITGSSVYVVDYGSDYAAALAVEGAWKI